MRFLTVAVVLLTACGRTERPAVIVADSAGIRVVTSFQPEWTDSNRWRVSSLPVVSIGSVDGPGEYTLYRVADALLLDNGTIIVAENGAKTIRLYDSLGVHVTTAGGEGAGPGEFQSITNLMRYRSDSLIVLQGLITQRASIFDGSGRFARSISLTGPSGAKAKGWPVGVLARTGVVMRTRLGQEVSSKVLISKE